MPSWFLYSLANAFFFSIYQALSNRAVKHGQYSKYAILFYATFIAALVQLIAAWWFGFPELEDGFFFALSITAVLNALAVPLMLRAYEIGEFSTVFSMLLLSPIFLLLTSFIILGEVPSIWGAVGVLLTVAGLTFASSEKYSFSKFNRGTWIAILVAFIFSISSNFDKLTMQRSDPFFAGFALNISIAMLSLVFLIFKKNGLKNLILRNKSDFWMLVPIGATLGVSSTFFLLAMSTGLVSYASAVKRLGLVFAILWGWLFFKEKNISKKILGAAVAIVGVLLIIFS